MSANERLREARHVNERHEIRRSGGWVRVTKALTLSTLGGALRVRSFELADGTRAGVGTRDRVMSRLAPKSEDSES